MSIGKIVEGLHQNCQSAVNESKSQISDNIDKKKFDVLEKKLNKAGFKFSFFSVYRFPNSKKIHKDIFVGKVDPNDKLMPTIDRDGEGFFVHPAFMGNLSVADARKMALNIDRTADIVEMLNRENFESYMMDDMPSMSSEK